MKVVLLQDVKNIGRIGDIAEVSDGYARNFLMPRGMAELASRKTVNSVDFQKRIERNREMRDRLEAEALAQGLQGATVTIFATVGDQNRIHGQITNQQVADAIEEQLGLAVDRHKIEIEQPVRTLGLFMLPVRISRGLEASINLEVAEEVEEIEEVEETEEEEAGEVEDRLPEAAESES